MLAKFSTFCSLDAAFPLFAPREQENGAAALASILVQQPHNGNGIFVILSLRICNRHKRKSTNQSQIYQVPLRRIAR